MDPTLTGSRNERGLAGDSEDGAAYLVQITSGERVCTPNVVPIVGACRIGRRSDDVSIGLMLDDGRASRLHAELRNTDGGWLLTDLGSKNGTEVDGRRLSAPRAVHDRAVIRIGDTLFVLRTRRRADDGLDDDGDLPGVSPEMADVRRAVRAVARSQHPVLVLGATGSGKEYAAWAIHRHAESSGPRVAVNVAELQPSLAAAELFGYEPGAYTGATASGAEGLVARADGGTLFLDEIGDLALDVQPTLLRFLESGEYRRVGSGTVSRSRARVVAATHVDLDAAVAQQQFRRDLLGRLRAYAEPITLPPLQSRREDILGWALRLGGPKALEGWSVTQLVHLLLHPYLEGLRELRRLVLRGPTQGAWATGPGSTTDPTRETPRRPVRAAATGTAIDKDNLVRLLTQHAGNVRQVAAELAVDRKRVYLELAKHGLRADDFRSH